MGGRGGRRTRGMPTRGRVDDVDEYGRGTEARTRRRHSCDARRFAWEKPSRPWIREAGTAMTSRRGRARLSVDARPFPDSYAARIASDERTPVMPRDAVASTARRVRAAPSPARRSRSLFRPHPSRKNPLVATPTVAGLRRRCEDATYLDGRADEGGHGNGESGHVVWSKNDECGVCERAPGVSARRLTRGFLNNFQPKPLTPKNEAGGLYQCKIQWKVDRRSRFTGQVLSDPICHRFSAPSSSGSLHFTHRTV